MRFSARGEYGVRVMVELARHHGDGPLSLADIATQEGLPLAYLEQIIGDLRHAGLVVARRGRRGGYQLTRSPETISMSEIVRPLEGGISPMVCIPDDPHEPDIIHCVHQDYCTTRVLWIKVRDSIINTLESTMLADLVPAVTPARSGRALPAPIELVVGVQPMVGCADLQVVVPETR